MCKLIPLVTKMLFLPLVLEFAFVSVFVFGSPKAFAVVSTNVPPLDLSSEVIPTGSRLYDAIISGRTKDAIEILNENTNTEWNLDRRFSKGWTLLHFAAYHGDPDLCLQLLKKGMRPDVRDHFGNTPLHIAARYEHVSCVLVFAMKGTPIDSANGSGKTPLHLAAENDCSLAVRALLRMGAKRDIQDEDGKTPQEYLDTRESQEIYLKTPSERRPVFDPRPDLLWEKFQDDFRLYGSDREKIRQILQSPRIDSDTRLAIIKNLLRKRGIEPDSKR